MENMAMGQIQKLIFYSSSPSLKIIKLEPN